MRFSRTLGAALLVSLSTIPAGSAALLFEVELPDLVGPDFSTRMGRPVSFDFGQEFLEIQGAWIEVEARVTAQQWDRCGRLNDPQPCVHVVYLLGFLAYMDKEGSPIPGIVFSEGLDFPAVSAVEASGTATAPFSNRRVGWDFLLDGKGSLTLYWNGLAFIPEDIIRNLTEPGGEIFGARLILDATPVEPPTARIEIDVQPGTPANRVNPALPGVIPVAILGSDTFDVSDVDPTTLAFGPNGALPISFAPPSLPGRSPRGSRGRSGALSPLDLILLNTGAARSSRLPGRGPQVDGGLTDVNGDGFVDLVTLYQLDETGITFGDQEACLTGQTFQGAPFEGCDALTVSLCRIGRGRAFPCVR